MLRKTMLLATVVAMVLGAAATALAASPGDGKDSPTKGTLGKSELGKNKEFSGLVDIGGGRKIYMTCQGSGSPTVVLVSGLGNAADIWSVTADPKNGPPVFDEVAKFTRVCAYDRPGTIRVTDDDKPSPSTPVEQPTSAKPAAADLDALLGASGEPGPYVLVGHSFGGDIVRLYASAHPAEVGGLVLVDALSEDLPNGLSPKQEALFEEINAAPPGSRREELDLPATFRQLRGSPPAPTVPTVVLTADRSQLPLTKEELAKEQLPAGVDEEFANDLWASQLAAQDKLAEKFPGAEHITNTNSTHYIQSYNPQLVSDSIRQVVDATRDDAKTHSRGTEGFGSATPSAIPSATPSATATVGATSSAGAGAAGAAQYQYASALPASGGVSPILLLAVIPAILLVGGVLLSARVIRIS
jgi:pimeloyl-ACP methyl ester carboxylesterase